MGAYGTSRWKEKRFSVSDNEMTTMVVVAQVSHAEDASGAVFYIGEW